MTAGVALVAAAFGADSPTVGDHENVALPTGVAFSPTVLPAQITVDAGVTFNAGNEFTVTDNVCVSVHPFTSVPVTV